MKIQKLKLVILLLIVLSLLFSSFVYADTLSVKVSINSAKLEEGKDYTMKAEINDINILNGINTIVTTFKYDENVFDKDSITFASVNGWQPLYDEESGVVIIENGTSKNTKEIFLSVHMKAKNSVDIQSTDITLERITAGGSGTGDLELGDVTLTLDKNNQAPEKKSESAIDFEVSGTAKTNQEIPQSSNVQTATETTGNTNYSQNNNSNANQELANEGTMTTTENNNVQKNNVKDLINNTTIQNKNGSEGTNIILVVVIVLAVLATIGAMIYIRRKGNKIYK